MDEHNKKSNFDNCPSQIYDTVPSEYLKLTFKELQPGQNYENKAIIGKVNVLYPLGKRATGHIRKLLLTDVLDNENCEKKLVVFLLNDFAEQSDTAEVNGYLIMTDFLVEKATHNKENEFPVQILVKNESKVWFARKMFAPKSKSSKKQLPPHKKMKIQSEDEDHIILNNHYEYVSLGELRETDPKESFNIYGIVEKCDLKINQGKKTQFLELVLTDETETGFACAVYAAKDENFPDIYPGDVVRAHRIQVHKFRGRLKGKCFSSKFILIFSKSNHGDRPRSVAKSFTYTEKDSDRVKSLFSWYNKKCEPKLISELQKGDFANILCQVIGIYVAKSSECVVLKIWDGTKSNQLEGSHLGLKTERLDEKLFLMARNYYINLYVNGQYAMTASALKPGQYIEVRDAHLYSPRDNPDDCKLSLHAGNKEERGIQILDANDEKIAPLRERLTAIVLEKETGNLTDDLLNINNSAFLNIDFSAFSSSQQSNHNNVEPQNISSPIDVDALGNPPSIHSDASDALNINTDAIKNPPPLITPKDPESQKVLISEVDASVVPGQSTQEFKEGMQKKNSSDQNHDNKESTSMELDVDALNNPLPVTAPNASESENVVISVVDASVLPGQSTQEFGEGMQKKYLISNQWHKNIASTSKELTIPINKSPMEFKAFLHNPPSQMSPTFFPLSSDLEDEWWHSIPTVSVTDNHSNVKPSSLSDIIHKVAPYKFRTLCAVLSVKPNSTSIVDLIRLVCPKCLYLTKNAHPNLDPCIERDGLMYFYCPECSCKESAELNVPMLEYSYLVSLELHDGTTSSTLEVNLFRENATKFFKGISPEEALKDQEKSESIRQMLWDICPNCRPFDSQEARTSQHNAYPILDCCVVSYKSGERNFYRVFDTKLV